MTAAAARRLAVLGTALVLAATGAAAAAEVYRWTDAEGNVHFGDNPPSGVEAQRVQPSTNVSEPAPMPDEGDGAERPGQEQGPDAGDDPSGRQKARAEQQQALPAEKCEQVRQRLTTLENRPGRVLVESDDGEVRRLPEEERQQRMQRLRGVLDERCGQSP